MCDGQYDVTEKVRKLYEKKKAMRDEAKAYYRKLVESPHRPVNDVAIFDPIMFRQNAAQAYAYEYYRPTFKGLFIPIVCFVSPMFLLTLYVYQRRKNIDQQLRTGIRAYKDEALRAVK